MQKEIKSNRSRGAFPETAARFILKHFIMETKSFQFGESVVNFEIDDKKVMVNATEMAKVFNAEVWNFLRLDGTKNFIEVCL